MATLVSLAVVALVVLVACGAIHNWPQSTVQRARRPEAAAERLRGGSQRAPIVLLRAPAATGPLLASMLALIALGTSTVLGAGWLSATTSYDATDHAYDRAVTVLSAQMESRTVSALVRTPGSTIATKTAGLADDVVIVRGDTSELPSAREVFSGSYGRTVEEAGAFVPPWPDPDYHGRRHQGWWWSR